MQGRQRAATIHARGLAFFLTLYRAGADNNREILMRCSSVALQKRVLL
jgi:hypothetical protein